MVLLGLARMMTIMKSMVKRISKMSVGTTTKLVPIGDFMYRICRRWSLLTTSLMMKGWMELERMKTFLVRQSHRRLERSGPCLALQCSALSAFVHSPTRVSGSLDEDYWNRPSRAPSCWLSRLLRFAPLSIVWESLQIRLQFAVPLSAKLSLHQGLYRQRCPRTGLCHF